MSLAHGHTVKVESNHLSLGLGLASTSRHLIVYHQSSSDLVVVYCWSSSGLLVVYKWLTSYLLALY